MATLIIPDMTLERLAANARAKELSLVAYLDDVASRDVAERKTSERQLAAIESFVEGMVGWTSRNLPEGHVFDDSRESIYEGRGE